MAQLGYSPNLKADGDRVQLYTAGAINQTAQLTHGGMILIAVLHGGDYDMVDHGIASTQM
jgi:holliday junction resolvase YEN1